MNRALFEIGAACAFVAAACVTACGTGNSTDANGAGEPTVDFSRSALTPPNDAGTSGLALLWKSDTNGLGEWGLQGTHVTGMSTASQPVPGPSGTNIPIGSAIAAGGTTFLAAWQPDGTVIDWHLHDATQAIHPIQYADTYQNNCAVNCPHYWRPIGQVSFLDSGGQGYSGLLWHNATTGEVQIWKRTSGIVGVSRRCGSSDGCSSSYRAVTTVDFDGDGNSDLMWFNAYSGEVVFWLLDASGTYRQSLSLDRHCGSSDGCSSDWAPIDAADVNGDGVPDLLWFGRGAGQLTTWLLNRNGIYQGSQALDQTCTAAQGCASWTPIGFARIDP